LILVYLVVLIAGLVLLEIGADRFTERARDLAERAGVSEMLAGLLTVGIEWEELSVVLIAALSGRTALAAGNVIGSCIANLGGSLGIGLLARPVTVQRDDRRIGWVMLGVTVCVAALAWLGRGTMARPVGLVLIALFVIYLTVLVMLFRRGLMLTLLQGEDDDHDDKKTGVRRGVAQAFLGALGGLALVVIGAELTVSAAVELARVWGLSEFVIGVTLVALGTTLPDTVVNVIAARRERGSLVMANAAGSNICNLLFSLGAAAIVGPLALGQAVLAFDVPFLLGVTALVVVMQSGARLTRRHGAVLVALYGVYLAGSLWQRGG
jgi:cation:H+ antiporter